MRIVLVASFIVFGVLSVPLFALAAPTVTLSVSPEYPETVHKGGTGTVSWTISGATTCTASDSTGFSGLWQTTSGSFDVSPTDTVTYELECWDKNKQSSGKKSQTLFFGPWVSLTADKTTIKAGESVVVSWDSDGRVCPIGPSGGGDGDLIAQYWIPGSITVKPVVTTTYAGVCHYPLREPPQTLSESFGPNTTQVPPLTITVLPADVGGGGGGGGCIPNTTCGAVTCQGQMCSDGCGGLVSGIKVCGGGSGVGSILGVTDCVIPHLGSNCLAKVSWATAGATNPEISTSFGGVFSREILGTDVSVGIPYGSFSVVLSDGNQVLDTKSVKATCVGTDIWSGGLCVTPGGSGGGGSGGGGGTGGGGGAGGGGGGSCVPNTACAMTTCQGQTCSDGCGGTVGGTKVCGGPVALSITLLAGSPKVTGGSPLSLFWYSTGAVSCTASSSGGQFSGALALTGTKVVTPEIRPETYTIAYTVTCKDAGGKSTEMSQSIMVINGKTCAEVGGVCGYGSSTAFNVGKLDCGNNDCWIMDDCISYTTATCVADKGSCTTGGLAYASDFCNAKFGQPICCPANAEAPVPGKCGPGGSCTIGTVLGLTDTGYSRTWACEGLNFGGTAMCSETLYNGSCGLNNLTCRDAQTGCSTGEQQFFTLSCGQPNEICCAEAKTDGQCINLYGVCVSGSCGADQEKVGTCGASQSCCRSNGTVPTSPPLPPGPPAPGPGPNPIAPPSPSADSPSLIPCGRNIDNKNTTDIDETKPCTLCHIVLGGQGLISWGLKIMAVIAITVIFAMGVLYILSAGNSGMMETAKGGMIASLIGFAVMLSAYLIVNVVLTILVDTASPDKPFLNLTATQGYFNFACDITSNVNGK